MLAGVFERSLQRLNGRLRVYCGDDDRKSAGLYYVVGGEYAEICGVDKGYVGEHTRWDEKGHIVHSGWRRVLDLLIKRRLVDRKRAESVFRTHLDDRTRQRFHPSEDKILRAINEAVMRNLSRNPSGGMLGRDDVVDIGREIRKRSAT